MQTLRTRGIIIKKTKVREADIIFTIFTDNLGKIKAYGRGVSKINSKLGGHLDLFSYVDLILVQGSGMYTIVYAKTLENFKKIKSELFKAGIAFYAGELIDAFILEDYKDTRIFNLLYNFFNILEFNNFQSNSKIKIIFWSFELKLLRLLGFLPMFKKCVQCSNDLNREDILFNLKLGGVLCSKCRIKEYSYEINFNTLKILNVLAENSFDYNCRLRVNKINNWQTKEVIDRYVIYLLDKKLKTPNLIANIDSLQKKFGL